MAGDISQLLDLDRGNELVSLKPLSDEAVQAIAKYYRGISIQYIEFIK